MALAGFGMLKATAHTKLLNLGSNFGGFVVFAIGGAVLWKLGLAMGVGQFIGAQIGSRFAMKNGAKIIRPLLVISCLAMATKLLADASSAWSIATIWRSRKAGEIASAYERLHRPMDLSAQMLPSIQVA